MKTTEPHHLTEQRCRFDGMTPLLRAAAIANHEGIAWLYSEFRSAKGPTTANSRAIQQARKQASVPGPEEGAARLAILRLLVERDRSQLDADPNGNMTPYILQNPGASGISLTNPTLNKL
jgi:hypothetical protein